MTKSQREAYDFHASTWAMSMDLTDVAAPALWLRIVGQRLSQAKVWYKWCCLGANEEFHEECVSAFAHGFCAEPRQVP